MPIVRCSIFEPDKVELEKRQKECGIPFWPHAFVTVHCDDMDKLVDSWNNEYAVLGYGENLYNELLDFCELTGIRSIPF